MNVERQLIKQDSRCEEQIIIVEEIYLKKNSSNVKNYRIKFIRIN